MSAPRAELLQELAEAIAGVEELVSLHPSTVWTPNPAQWRYIQKCSEVLEAPGAGNRVSTILWLGGNDTGKTRTLNEIINTIVNGPQSPWFGHECWRRLSARPTRGLVISTRRALEEGLVRELRQSLGATLAPGYPKHDGMPYPAVWRMQNGAEFRLATWDQGVTAHAGAMYDWIVKDEPGGKDVSDEADARLRRGGPVFWGMTPVDETGYSRNVGWIFDRITTSEETGKGGMFVVYADCEDNCEEHGVERVRTPDGKWRIARGIVPHDTVQDKYDRWKADSPATLQARFYGLHVRELGKVLKEWSAERNVMKTVVQPPWERYCALDVHPSKPQMLVYAVRTPYNRLVIHREIVSESLVGKLAAEIKDLFQLWGWPQVQIIDPLAATPNPLTGTSFLSELNGHGFQFRTAGQEKSDKQLGIMKMREMIKGDDRGPLLVVDPSCAMTIAQARRWQVDMKTMAPAKEHDDMWENIYRIVLNLPDTYGFQRPGGAFAQKPNSSLVI